jgi:hypothetical protein
MVGNHRKKKEDLLSFFREYAFEQQRLVRQAEMLYRPEVEAVIRERSQEVMLIEQLLDGILDFCFDSDMLLLYKKLCCYYYQIDPQATASYIFAYRDMWDNGDKNDPMESGYGNENKK